MVQGWLVTDMYWDRMAICGPAVTVDTPPFRQCVIPFLVFFALILITRNCILHMHDHIILFVFLIFGPGLEK